MTDGLESGAQPTVGNTDNPSGADGFNPGSMAARMQIDVSNTLADVAMHYYQRDLRPALSDLVPTNPLDQAPSPTYGDLYHYLRSGFNGSLTQQSLSEPGWPYLLA